MAEGFHRAEERPGETYVKGSYERLRQQGWKGREELVIGWGNVLGERSPVHQAIDQIEDSDAYRTTYPHGAQTRTMYSPLARIAIGEILSEMPEHGRRREQLLAEVSRLRGKYGAEGSTH